MAYITIVKGDDTDFLENQYIVVNFNTELELTGFQAIFNLDNIEIVYPDLSAKYIEIILSKDITASLKKGKMYGKLRIIDTENRIRTVTTAIPFNIVTKVMNASQISKQSIQLEVSVTKNEFNVDMNILGLSKRVAQDYLTQMKQYDAKLTEKVQTVKNIEANINKTDVNCQNFALQAKNWANSENIVDNIDFSAKYYANQAAQSATELDNTIAHINTTRASVALDNLSNDGIKSIQKHSACAFEIGDIGISPLGIDESQGKRRYLNGQVIIQEQFVTFTEKLKSAVELYPTLACSEDDWQATSLLTVGGQCGKFVIDNEAGTIRLPKIIMPIQGLTDLGNLAEIVNAGLPNITATFSGWTNARLQSGATIITGSQNANTGSGNYSIDQYYSFDASRSSSVYGNSNTVQPEAVQYPYFIQVARGVEESVDVVRDIELNNPFSLLDYKYSEYELNNLAWLKSNGQWNPSTIYVSVYELLLKIYNGTETKSGISVKPITEDYADTDFVINTSDKSFKLPTSVANSGLGSLYFYIGETVQNANLVNVGRIEENFAGLVEVGGSIGMPSEKYIDLTLGADATIYTAPADGYYSLNMTSTGTQYMCMTNQSNLMQSYMLAPATGWRNSVWLPVKKGDQVNIGYNYPQANVNWFRFIYAEGSKWEAYQ